MLNTGWLSVYSVWVEYLCLPQTGCHWVLNECYITTLSIFTSWSCLEMCTASCCFATWEFQLLKTGSSLDMTSSLLDVLKVVNREVARSCVVQCFLRNIWTISSCPAKNSHDQTSHWLTLWAKIWGLHIFWGVKILLCPKDKFFFMLYNIGQYLSCKITPNIFYRKLQP